MFSHREVHSRYEIALVEGTVKVAQNDFRAALAEVERLVEEIGDVPAGVVLRSYWRAVRTVRHTGCPVPARAVEAEIFHAYRQRPLDLAHEAQRQMQLLGVLPNRNVRGPLVPLTDEEVAALRRGLSASGLI